MGQSSDFLHLCKCGLSGRGHGRNAATCKGNLGLSVRQRKPTPPSQLGSWDLQGAQNQAKSRMSWDHWPGEERAQVVCLGIMQRCRNSSGRWFQHTVGLILEVPPVPAPLASFENRDWAKHGAQSYIKGTACVLGILDVFPQAVGREGRRKAGQERVNVTVFFLLGVLTLFGMSSGSRVPEKWGCGWVGSLKKGLLSSLLTGPKKVQVMNLKKKRKTTIFVLQVD